jgi:hypothetical protein
MKRNATLVAWLGTLLLTMTCCLSASPARAVTVSIAPSDTSVCPNDEFEVRAVVDAFPNLKGFSLIYQYDPTRLLFLGATPGDVLTSSGNPYVANVVPDYAAPNDSVYYDAAMLIGTTQGPGILAFFRFKALAPGITPLVCQLADFRDPQNVQTLPACNGALIEIVPVCATGSRHSTWGRVKMIYR